MKIFDAKKYKEDVLKSTSIDNCEKIELPASWEGKKYIFISYSHKNYKQVYSDLADMYANGIVFWYDKGLTPGEYWDKEAQKRINDPNCVGVIFYLSTDFFISESVYKEIKYADQRFGRSIASNETNAFFSVNLEKKAPQSVLFFDVPKMFDEGTYETSHIEERLSELHRIFDNKIKYLSYSEIDYTKTLIDVIANRFDVKGDEVASPSQIDLLFSVMDSFSNIRMKNYSKQYNGDFRSCRITRTCFIALCKEICHEDLDVILSEDYTVEELNRIVSDSENTILLELKARELFFIDINGFICINYTADPDNQDNEIDSYQTLKYIYSSYINQESIHENFSSQKKREINLSISEYLAAMAQNNLFKTSEQKAYFQSIIEKLIITHNHYCNYMYAILYDWNSKKIPVQLDEDVVFDFVGRYFDDVFQTNHDSVMFINNLLGSLKFLDESKKVNVLRNLVYSHHCYNFRLIKELVELTKGTEISSIRNWLRVSVFSIARSSERQSKENYAILMAFLCMFSRGDYPKVCYSVDPLYNKEFYEIIKFALRNYSNLVKLYPERSGDLHYASYKAVMTLFSTNNEYAAQVFSGIDINNPCFDEAWQLRNLYDLVVNGVVSDNYSITESKSEFMEFFDIDDDNNNEEQFFKYLEEKLLDIKENPFLPGNGLAGNPLLLPSFTYLQKMLHDKKYDYQYFDVKKLCDKMVFWMIESIEQNPNPTYIRIIIDTPYCFDCRNTASLKKTKKLLYRDLLLQQRFDLLPIEKMHVLWHSFYSEIRDDRTSQLADAYNNCIKYCFNYKNNIHSAEFLLNALNFCDDTIKLPIYNYLKEFTLSNASTINYKFIHTVVENMRKHKIVDDFFAKKLTEIIPQMKQLSDSEKTIFFGDVASLSKYYVITDSIIAEGKNSPWYNTISMLLGIKNLTWERVSLFGICSKLLNPERYKQLEDDLKLKLTHYVKNLPEYNELLPALIESLISDGTFSKMSSVLKTALILHAGDYLDIFEEKYAVLKEFTDEIIRDLSYSVLSHSEIHRKYGVRTETLTFHLLNIYKYKPEDVAIICAKSLSQTYGQIIYSINNLESFDYYNQKLAHDRSFSFKQKISNPCIKNIALYFCNKIYNLLNMPGCSSAKRLFSDLYSMLVEVKRGNWPKWFDIEPADIEIMGADNVVENAIVDINDYETIFREVSPEHEKEIQEDFALWRQKDDVSIPYFPISHSLIDIFEKQGSNSSVCTSSYVVSYKYLNKYYAISGADAIRMCQETSLYDIAPTKISTILIEIGTCVIHKKQENVKTSIGITAMAELFDDIYDRILKTVPDSCIKRKDNIIRFKADDSLSKFKSKKVLESSISYYIQEFNNFLAFYFCYIKRYNNSIGGYKPIIKEYALPAYFEYYEKLQKTIDNFEKQIR